VAMKASAGSRVLMLLENNPYPQDGRVRREAATLASAGYQVSIISPKRTGQPWRETVNDVSTYRFPAPPEANGFLGYLREYGYAMAATFILSWLVFFREGFDIIHAHNPPDTFVFIAAFYKLLGKRFVFDHHDLSPEMYYARFGGGGNRLVHQVLVWLEKLSCKLADHVIATNQSYRMIEMKRGGVPEERITIVRNGPDLKRVRPVEPDPALRKKGKTIIGYVGVMGFQDGIDYFLRALHHLANDLERTDFFCILIGRGDAWASMRILATQLNLDGYVWFTGRVSDADLIRYLSTADICVDPDPSNDFNDRCTMIKMTEYMALGKPIVAFDLPEHRFTAQDAAVYARPNNELDFARQIARLMDNPEQRQKMGQIGRGRIETELAWIHQEQYLLKAYEALDLLEKQSASVRT
jgi:glycosyltransferase involved in cell wall biosynthesis